MHYNVKWKGHPHEENTWEPEENLENAMELVDNFNRATENPLGFITPPKNDAPTNSAVSSIKSILEQKKAQQEEQKQ